MATKGILIIFGSLILIIGLILIGLHVGHIGYIKTAGFMIVTGIVLAIIWIISIFDLASAMNLDH